MALTDLDVKQIYTYNEIAGDQVFPIPFKYFDSEDVKVIKTYGSPTSDSFGPNITNINRIPLTGHEFTTGQQVTLSSTDTLPTGLSAQNYYVKDLGNNEIALAATEAVAKAVDTDIKDFAAAAVESGGSDTIEFSGGHVFTDGQAVIYNGTAVTELTDGFTYYVIYVTDTLIKLEDSVGGGAIDISAGSSTSTLTASGLVEIAITGGSGTHSIIGVTNDVVLNITDDYTLINPATSMHPTAAKSLPQDVTLNSEHILADSTETLTVVRDVNSGNGSRDGDVKQGTSLSTFGEGKQVEEAIDRNTAYIQEIQEEVDRAIKLPITSSSGANLDLPEPEANKFLGWNSGATNLENKDGSATDSNAIHIDTNTPDTSTDEFSAANDLTGALDAADRLLVEEASGSPAFQKGYAPLSSLVTLVEQTLNQAVIDHGSLAAASLLDDDHVRYSDITSGAGAPVSTPTRVGNIYIDTTADEVYVSVDTVDATSWLALGSVSGTSLASLSDTESDVTSSASDNDFLMFNSGTGKWENSTAGLNDLSDTSATITSGASEGEAVVFNATSGKWENRKISSTSGGLTPAGNLRAQMIRIDGVGSTSDPYFGKNFTWGTESNANGFIRRITYITTGRYFINFKAGQFSGYGPFGWGAYDEIDGTEKVVTITGTCPSGVYILVGQSGGATNQDFGLVLQQPYTETLTKDAGEIFETPVPLSTEDIHTYGGRANLSGDNGVAYWDTAASGQWVGITDDGGRTWSLKKSTNNMSNNTVNFSNGWDLYYHESLIFDSGTKWVTGGTNWNYLSRLETQNTVMSGDMVEDFNTYYTTAVIRDNGVGGLSNSGQSMFAYSEDGGTDKLLGMANIGSSGGIGWNCSFDLGQTWRKYSNVLPTSRRYYDLNGGGSPTLALKTGPRLLTQRFITEAGAGPTAVTVLDDVNEEFDFASHTFETGDKVQITGAGTAPTGLSKSTDYYARNVSSTTISFHPTEQDAHDNTNKIPFSNDGATPLDVSVPAIDKHKSMMFTHQSGTNNNWAAGDLVLIHFYGTTHWYTNEVGLRDAINIYDDSANLAAGNTWGLTGVMEDTSVGGFTALVSSNYNVNPNKAVQYLSHIAESELVKDAPTSPVFEGEINPMQIGANGIHISIAGVTSITADYSFGYNTSNIGIFDRAQRFIKHRVKKVGSTKTLISVFDYSESESTANLDMYSSIIIVPEYDDLTTTKPYMINIRTGREEGGGIGYSHGTSQLVTDDNGDIFVVFRKYDFNNAANTGAMFICKLDISGATGGVATDAANLVVDPWFDNEGTGVDTTKWDGTWTSTQFKGQNCAQIAFGNTAETIAGDAVSLTSGQVYQVSGIYSISDTNAEFTFAAYNGSSEKYATAQVNDSNIDTDEWREFYFEFTANASESVEFRVKNTGSAGNINVTNLVVSKKYVGIDTTWGTNGYKELSSRPVDANGNVDIEAGFCGDLLISSDGQTIQWTEEDNLAQRKLMFNNVRQVV